MNRSNDKSMKEAFEQMLQVYKLKRRFHETSLIAFWPEMVGKSVANRTKNIYIKDRRLYVRLESSTIKHELLMIRTQILDKMNERAGSSVIDEIVFL
jgi:predicted nucleic acid-binding Zn ribbon protein